MALWCVPGYPRCLWEPLPFRMAKGGFVCPSGRSGPGSSTQHPAGPAPRSCLSATVSPALAPGTRWGVGAGTKVR